MFLFFFVFDKNKNMLLPLTVYLFVLLIFFRRHFVLYPQKSVFFTFFFGRALNLFRNRSNHIRPIYAASIRHDSGRELFYVWCTHNIICHRLPVLRVCFFNIFFFVFRYLFVLLLPRSSSRSPVSDSSP